MTTAAYNDLAFNDLNGLSLIETLEATMTGADDMYMPELEGKYRLDTGKVAWGVKAHGRRVASISASGYRRLVAQTTRNKQLHQYVISGSEAARGLIAWLEALPPHAPRLGD